MHKNFTCHKQHKKCTGRTSWLKWLEQSSLNCVPFMSEVHKIIKNHFAIYLHLSHIDNNCSSSCAVYGWSPGDLLCAAKRRILGRLYRPFLRPGGKIITVTQVKHSHSQLSEQLKSDCERLCCCCCFPTFTHLFYQPIWPNGSVSSMQQRLLMRGVKDHTSYSNNM